MNGLSAEEILSRRHWLAAYGMAHPCGNQSGRLWFGAGHAVEAAMRRYAEKPAFRCFGRTLTYADTDRLSRTFAAYLQNKLGVRKGDRIAVMLPNLPAFPLAMLGIVRAGAVQVNVNLLYTPREPRAPAQRCGRGNHRHLQRRRRRRSPRSSATPKIKHVIAVDTGDGVGAELPSPPVDTRLANVIAFSNVITEGDKFTFALVALERERPLCSCNIPAVPRGWSKGAALTHRNLVGNTEQFKAFTPDALRPGKESRRHGAAALSHLRADGEFHHLLPPSAPRTGLVPNPRDMDGFIEVLRKVRCTIFTGAEHAVRRTAHASQNRGKSISSGLRVAIGGGAAVLPTTSAKWKALTGQNILEGYGLSETSPVLTLNPATRDGFSATVGLPFPSTDIKLLNAADEEAALPGEPGEILRQRAPR